MKIQRDQGFSVKQSGGIAGYPRSTTTFDDPKFKNVFNMSVKSYVKGDEKSTKELDRLNAQVDPFFKYKKLQEGAEQQFKTLEQILQEKNKRENIVG